MQQDDAMDQNQDQDQDQDQGPEQDQPETTEHYVPGTANGHHYMARLCRAGDGPWTIDIVHVEGLPPLADSGRHWPTREAAAQAAEQLVAALAH
jgi:hypothetical protein